MAKTQIMFSLTGGKWKHTEGIAPIVERICDIVVGRHGKPERKVAGNDNDWDVDIQGNNFWVHLVPGTVDTYTFSGRYSSEEKYHALEVVFREFLGLNVSTN